LPRRELQKAPKECCIEACANVYHNESYGCGAEFVWLCAHPVTMRRKDVMQLTFNRAYNGVE